MKQSLPRPAWWYVFITILMLGLYVYGKFQVTDTWWWPRWISIPMTFILTIFWDICRFWRIGGSFYKFMSHFNTWSISLITVIGLAAVIKYLWPEMSNDATLILGTEGAVLLAITRSILSFRVLDGVTIHVGITVRT